MKYLFDTHVFIWYAVGDERLSPRAKDLIESRHERFISMASIWEMAIKVNIGHLEFREPFDKIIANQFRINSYKLLNLKLQHLFKFSGLPLHHRDPFDRLIISQALVEDIPIVSVDEKFNDYGVDTIW
jgi:PIN domain nuclease of toxin-antitoxin system